MLIEKICTKCGVSKPLDQFSLKKGGKYGRRAFCKPCGVADSLAWQKANPEKTKARQSKWLSCNRIQAREATKNWVRKNPEKQRAAVKDWGLRNKERRAATLAKRRASKLKRTPAWLSPQDFKTMEFIYEMARVLTEVLGVPHHVDHEIPLLGELASGLHVPSNLQIIPASENLKKSNSWNPDQ